MTSPQHKRFPSKKNALKTLRNLGVEFGCVLDVGVQAATAELIEVFPDIPLRQGLESSDFLR